MIGVGDALPSQLPLEILRLVDLCREDQEFLQPREVVVRFQPGRNVIYPCFIRGEARPQQCQYVLTPCFQEPPFNTLFQPLLCYRRHDLTPSR